MIPTSLLLLLENYKEIIEENISLIETILTECSQELPNKYPDKEALEGIAFNWIYKRYNNKFICLEERAKEITNYVRKYFDTDNLFD